MMLADEHSFEEKDHMSFPNQIKVNTMQNKSLYSLYSALEPALSNLSEHHYAITFLHPS
jgi:hypothetical protein